MAGGATYVPTVLFNEIVGETIDALPPEVPPVERCVLFAVAMDFQREGPEAIFDVERIARRCTLPEKATKRCLEALKSAGHIDDMRRRFEQARIIA